MTRISLAGASAAALLLFAVPSHAETIFVSNEKDNTVTVIDGETLKTQLSQNWIWIIPFQSLCDHLSELIKITVAVQIIGSCKNSNKHVCCFDTTFFSIKRFSDQCWGWE
jgi:hypothetical protein